MIYTTIRSLFIDTIMYNYENYFTLKDLLKKYPTICPFFPKHCLCVRYFDFQYIQISISRKKKICTQKEKLNAGTLLTFVIRAR